MAAKKVWGDEPRAVLMPPATTSDGLVIIKVGATGLSIAIVLIGWAWFWPSTIFEGAAGVGGTIAFYGVLIALRGLYVWRRARNNPVSPIEKEGWQSHPLHEEDGWEQYRKDAALAAAKARAERRSLPWWKRVRLAVSALLGALKVFLHVVFLLALFLLLLVVAGWASYWVFERATTDYGLLAGILIATPFWFIIWSIAGAIYSGLSEG